MNPGSASPARADGHPQARVLWLVPSRGRPGNVARLFDAFATLGARDSGPDSPPWSDLVFIIDGDDPELDGYLANGVPHAHYSVRHPALPGVDAAKRMGEIVNDAWTVYGMAHGYEAVGFMGDDHLPRTDRFDYFLTAALWGPAPGPSFGVAWGDDLLMGDAFPTAGLLGAGMLDVMGYMVPPGFKHLCIDVVWSDIAKAIGRRHYLPDVIIEHVHPAAGKAKLDAGYESNNDAATVEHDSVEFGRWSGGSRMTDFRPTVARIMEAMDG
jgi:hypothetical protein